VVIGRCFPQRQVVKPTQISSPHLKSANQRHHDSESHWPSRYIEASPAQIAGIKAAVDDPNRDVRPLIEHILFSDGHTVAAAGTFAGAMKLLEGGTYDLLLTDGGLGDGDGLDLADVAKARGIMTLIFTGYASQFPRDRLARHPYIWKPVRPAELLDVVRRLLSQERG